MFVRHRMDREERGNASAACRPATALIVSRCTVDAQEAVSASHTEPHPQAQPTSKGGSEQRLGVRHSPGPLRDLFPPPPNLSTTLRQRRSRFTEQAGLSPPRPRASRPPGLSLFSSVLNSSPCTDSIGRRCLGHVGREGAETGTRSSATKHPKVHRAGSCVRFGERLRSLRRIVIQKGKRSAHACRHCFARH